MVRFFMAVAMLGAALLTGCGGSDDPAPIACVDLAARVTLSNASITSTTAVPAGDFSTPAQGVLPAGTIAAMPAFCRVIVQAAPTSDSSIGIEVWIPATGWNQKYMQLGTLAYSGFYPYAQMGIALKRGYAIAVALGAAAWQYVLFKPNALIWALFLLTPAVPLLDRVWPGERFAWRRSMRRPRACDAWRTLSRAAAADRAAPDRNATASWSTLRDPPSSP